MTSLSEPLYDIFISYKTRRYLNEASLTAELLAERGFRVWFDRKVLDEKKAPGELWGKDELRAILTTAVRNSRCAVVFEAQLEAVALPPGVTQEEVVADKRAMLTEHGALIAWNWQKLEIDAARRGIEVHPREILVFDRDRQGSGGSDIGRRTYDDLDQLQEVLCEALELLRVEPSSANEAS